jgi:hypothetical protein
VIIVEDIGVVTGVIESVELGNKELVADAVASDVV